MESKHIVIGIDLGTTNSAVTVSHGGEWITVKNSLGDEHTPSVFGVDKAKNRVVGKKAYERLYRDASVDEVKNNKGEIKRIMGTEDKIEFPRLGKSLTPEEISAEILKSLRDDVLRKYPDINTTGVVITIPAAFSTLQSEATKRAGQLAGFDYVVLLQEPIAAALAYGFKSNANENYLVYDLGGGTFDVAVISSKNGRLSVLNHEGNNFLGGKNFDTDIVDKIIVPKILESFKLKDFSRSNKRFNLAFAKLKRIAENTKIELSQQEKINIEVDNIGNDNDGKEIYLSFNITRKQFEDTIKAQVSETIKLSQKSLKDAGVKNSSINKIILIGGSTQIPFIRKALEKELGIKIDATQDPLTAVSRGACIYGTSQVIQKPGGKEPPAPAGYLKMELLHEQLTSETEEWVAGKIEKLAKAKKGEYSLQIQADSGSYSSNKIDLAGGKFREKIVLEENKQNVFWLYITDKKGKQLKVSPEMFSITHGVSTTSAPLPHSIGIVLSDRSHENDYQPRERVDRLIDKNSPLPQGIKKTYKTTIALKKDTEMNGWLTLVEGESEIPDRNTYTCKLGIKGADLPNDVPVGEDVEIEVNIDESRTLTLSAYIPLIDCKFDDVRMTILDVDINVKDLVSELAEQKEIVKKIYPSANKGSESTKSEIESVMHKIASVERTINNSANDPDALRHANKELKDIKIALDKIKLEGEGIESLYKKFEKIMQEAKKIIAELNPDNGERYTELLEGMQADATTALKNKDVNAMHKITYDLRILRVTILADTLEGAKLFFDELINWIKEKHSNLLQKPEIKKHIENASKAYEKKEVAGINNAREEVLKLVPAPRKSPTNGKPEGPNVI